MPYQFPSDRLEVPGAEALSVGAARDFLEEYVPRGPEDTELLVIAQGLRALLHNKVDRNEHGATRLLPEEHDRRAVASEEFLQMPRIDFPE